MWATPKGFTIVELLIVIVVVGILATVSVVAYNGAQTKAQNSQTTSGVATYVKAIRSHAVSKGTYPVETAYPCLGPIGTTCARMSGTSTTCTASGGDGGTSAQASFDTNIRDVLAGTLPTVSKQVLDCGGNTYSGAYYRPSTGTTAQIVYYLRGDQSCSGIGGVDTFSKTQQEGITRCVATLPSL